MPIYEYTCKKCDHVHDEMRSIDSRDSPIDCPECEHNECSRNITGAMGAVDTLLTPDRATGGQFSQMIDKIKRGTPKSYHKNLDRTSNHNGSWIHCG
jgi:putative FmdB family regulatory protein